ncbi:MAG TPA: FAD-dependent thymidylate synthase [Miltoncostaeaceae bacterium]|nr:FAD-dependent thymidylate synthase [Miltoncostaeaceae bacterium]
MDLTAEERERVRPYVTDIDGPVFALVNLPETVKGALFARYSRSPKPLRRLLVDEFLADAPPAAGSGEAPGSERAEALYGRVLADYGDDSVAQLGAVHLAVEGASNVLTKVLQWGRLASYLEQSTRYIAYTDRPGGHWRYHRPPHVLADPEAGPAYTRTLDRAFAAYAALVPALTDHWDRRVPGGGDDPARARAVRARALDSLRGLLPAATTSNMGIFASGQAYEALLVRLQAHPLAEARACGEAMLAALRQVIPAFLVRVDRPDRGVRHARYLAATRDALEGLAGELLPAPSPGPAAPRVALVDHDPDGEERVVAHALWPASGLPLADVRAAAAAMAPHDRLRVLTALTGDRADRRERPGRALEATAYTFDVVCDYGAYRDLQRHRMLTLQVQPLTPQLGWEMPAEVGEAGGGGDWERTMRESAALHGLLRARFPEDAPYAVSLAHRIRFTLTLNARELMHLVELRSQPQGHPAYRAVAQAMHRAVAEEAGHRALAATMRFVDASDPVAGRLAAERRGSTRG